MKKGIENSTPKFWDSFSHWANKPFKLRHLLTPVRVFQVAYQIKKYTGGYTMLYCYPNGRQACQTILQAAQTGILNIQIKHFSRHLTLFLFLKKKCSNCPSSKFIENHFFHVYPHASNEFWTVIILCILTELSIKIYSWNKTQIDELAPR